MKLINVNDKIFTVLDILIEFDIFYEEVQILENLSIRSESVIIECVDCMEENFDRFEQKTSSNCVICMEKIEEDGIKLDCPHIFHKKCAQDWFIVKNTCPSCRRPIKPCECGGAREYNRTFQPTLENFIHNNVRSTGLLSLDPYEMRYIEFVSLIYDRETNVFKLSHFI
jgi:hypothetical protein